MSHSAPWNNASGKLLGIDRAAIPRGWHKKTRSGYSQPGFLSDRYLKFAKNYLLKWSSPLPSETVYAIEKNA